MAQVRVLTTGEAAKYCGVNFRTVIRWIERGKLKAYKLPGRGDHRIREEDFVSFLRDNDLPVPEEFATLSQSVLVVEDNRDMASAIARVLHRQGYQIEVAHDGFEAGAQLAAIKPALITLDLKMPGLDGFSVLDYIRARDEYRHLKILVISAETDDALQRALAQGADAVLSKPFDNEVLIDTVNGLIARGD